MVEAFAVLEAAIRKTRNVGMRMISSSKHPTTLTAFNIGAKQINCQSGIDRGRYAHCNRLFVGRREKTQRMGVLGTGLEHLAACLAASPRGPIAYENGTRSFERREQMRRFLITAMIIAAISSVTAQTTSRTEPAKLDENCDPISTGRSWSELGADAPRVLEEGRRQTAASRDALMLRQQKEYVARTTRPDEALPFAC
jgi:hypothetical protein